MFPSTSQKGWPDSLGSEYLAASCPPPAQAKDQSLKASLKTRVQHAEIPSQDTWCSTSPYCAPTLLLLRVRPQLPHQHLIPCARARPGKGPTLYLIPSRLAHPSLLLPVAFSRESRPAHLGLRPLPLLAHSPDINCLLSPPVPTLLSLCSTCLFSAKCLPGSLPAVVSAVTAVLPSVRD